MESTRFLGTIISRDLKWELNINALIKKAQMRMYFLRQLRKFRLSQSMMVKFYTAIIESILTLSITVWFPTAMVKDNTRVERVIRSAERVTGHALPSLKSLYEVRAEKRARKIMKDPSHPGHGLFEVLPSGKRLRLRGAKLERHLLSFYPNVVRLINYSL